MNNDRLDSVLKIVNGLVVNENKNLETHGDIELLKNEEVIVTIMNKDRYGNFYYCCLTDRMYEASCFDELPKSEYILVFRSLNNSTNIYTSSSLYEKDLLIGLDGTKEMYKYDKENKCYINDKTGRIINGILFESIKDEEVFLPIELSLTDNKFISLHLTFSDKYFV